MHGVMGAARGLGMGVVLMAAMLALAATGGAQAASQNLGNTVTCAGKLPVQKLREGASNTSAQQPNLVISKHCTVNSAGNYYYGNVNIIAGGSLTFIEPQRKGSRVDFWASNIIVENGGALMAGSASAPYGSRGGVLNIFIYGPNQSGTSDPATTPGQGALCYGQLSSTTGPCGIPLTLWNTNGDAPRFMPGEGKIFDNFYQYGPNYGDNLCTDGTQWANGACGTANGQVGYFGYKVLAVSYGGTLDLFGYKGTPLKKPKTHRFFRFFPLRPSNQGTGNGNSLPGLSNPAAPEQSDNTDETAAPGDSAAAPVNPEAVDADPRDTGFSWMRLAANLSSLPAAQSSSPNTLTLSKAPGDHWWSSRDNKSIPDQVVVTTTDYLPGHSELLTISSLDGKTLSFTDAINYPHNGTKYAVGSRLSGNTQRYLDAGMDPDLINNGAETRAAVALLTRSIRIVSAGDTAGETWEMASKKSTNCQTGQAVPYCYYFGANTVFRQGFKQVQIQGVEFANMGQGGKLGHYPVHFHMARRVPTDTFVKDSSINQSMTRWIVLHSTQGVLLQRNVGWESIGHGFFLENGTETDNKFYSNLGIFARAAVSNPQNPRNVPGIFSAGPSFADNGPPLTTYSPNAFPFASDIQQPTVFWISNGWNEFVGNMAAGAGACGTAYWLVSAQNSDMPDVPSSSNTNWGGEMKWTGYASLQNNATNASSTPLEVFYGNYATSTMNSFETVPQVTPCVGVDYPGQTPTFAQGNIQGTPGFAPAPTVPTNGMLSNQPANGTTYYPYVSGSGRLATLCPTTGGNNDCTSITGAPPNGAGSVAPCNNGANEAACAVTVLDHFTSSFHWSEQNFAAIWLRPQWYLVTNSVITDVQTAGITFVSGGDYTRSSSIQGGWKLIRDSLLAGYTQSASNGYSTNGYSANGGPFMNQTAQSLSCDNATGTPAPPPAQACTSLANGVSFPLSNFGTGQRLFSIYDGPAYQDSNIYLDITPTACGNGTVTGACMYGTTLGLRQQTVSSVMSCYLPNAAIGWKQPNGFFYPPTFHSTNLFFGNVGIRHYVIDALFQYGTYLEDTTTASQDYCPGGGYSSAMFSNFTDIDRQTELTDDDGTLTGLTNNSSPATGTVSVNPATFFTAPVQTDQCLSDVGVTPSLACPVSGQPQPLPTPATAITSPYEYVTAAVYPQCGVTGISDNSCSSFSGAEWGTQCSNPTCYGIPLYRQYLAGAGTSSANATGEVAYWFSDGCNTNPTTSQCRWPFVRMGGEDSDQRSTMTVNLGTYFLDTEVTQATQQNENGEAFSFVNVFQGGQTYYVYFLYAKPDTQQTYQIYVGPGFDVSTGVQGLRLIPEGWPLNWTSNPATSNVNLMGAGNLPTGWTAHYNDSTACGSVPNCYILQVTTNFSQLSDIVPQPSNGLCLPSSFCTASGESCGCALTKDDPLAKHNPAILAQCQQACSVWSVKDLDFPPAGAYGFAFTLPSSFVPDGQGQAHRPTPTTFPTTASSSSPNWLTQFLNTAVAPDSTSGGSCYYSSVPGSTNCAVSWPNPTGP